VEAIMGYYYNQEKYKQRGIDYDLTACLENNATSGFTIEDIERVEAVVEGVNDESDWHWIVTLKDGSFFYVTGWCDYTGWDCASSATYCPAETVAEALSHCYDTDIRAKLQEKISTERWETWRTLKDAEFGLGKLVQAIAQDAHA
jgi:hypothetical protein